MSQKRHGSRHNNTFSSKDTRFVEIGSTANGSMNQTILPGGYD